MKVLQVLENCVSALFRAEMIKMYISFKADVPKTAL